MDSSGLSASTTSALYDDLAAGEFRTLLLFPGVPGDPIRARLRLASFDSNPEYDALSYVWGDPHDTIDVLCNDLPTPITANLHAALVRVRSPQKPINLWADALCINQQDKAERGHQVGLMGRIYSSARLVLAYMGSSPDHAGARAIAGLLRDCLPIMDKSKPNTKDPRWRWLGPLFGNAWFRRAWVVQEVGLAKNPRLVYDDIDFSYRQLMAVVNWLMLEAAAFATDYGFVPLPVHVWWPDWSGECRAMGMGPIVGKLKLVDLLQLGSALACQDPRDHVYAFLGHPLAKSNDRAIIPDYQKEDSQVFREVMEYLLAENDIRALAFVGHTDASLANSDMPSWVIRWDVRIPQYKALSSSYAAYGDRAAAQIIQENDTLLVRGLEVDMVRDAYRIEVDHQARLLSFTHCSSPQALFLEDILNRTSTVSSPYPDIDCQKLALAWSLCAGTPGAQIGVANFAAAWNAYRHWARLPRGNMHPLAYLFWLAIRGVCTNRALVVTDKGYHGLAPALTRPGDLYCIFDGAGITFICRPLHRESRGSSRDVRLVGEAYVQGLDQGQSVDMFRRREAKGQVFRIT